jgi:hypothetical protein
MRPEIAERMPKLAVAGDLARVRHVHFEHEQCDRDRDHAVAEGFEAVGIPQSLLKFLFSLSQANSFPFREQ